jgi:hypothetical protein
MVGDRRSKTRTLGSDQFLTEYSRYLRDQPSAPHPSSEFPALAPTEEFGRLERSWSSAEPPTGRSPFRPLLALQDGSGCCLVEGLLHTRGLGRSMLIC